MEIDNILEIGINTDGSLYLKPASLKFPYIYREAMEVNWNEKENCLYTSKPKKWSYYEWYKQIQSAVKEQSANLIITKETEWVNISEELKNEIIELRGTGTT